MQATREVDYAVRAVLYLARLEPARQVSTAAVSREQGIPSSFLAKIVTRLSAAGVLCATRGLRGGIRLARPAQTVSLLDVVEAIEGPLALNTCVLDQQACHLALSCPVRDVWCQAQADLAQRLAQTNFGELARQAERLPPPAAPTMAL